MLPLKHPKEPERLAALRGLNVLDTPEEQRFDDLTHLASMICDAPIALVSLVDADRQWFKSRLGIEACDTDLERSVCAHTILSDDILIIEDTTKHPISESNPLNAEIDMRFYAGVPLIGKDGLPYGSLCVLDNRPRTLTASQIEALGRLGRQVVSQLESNLLLVETEAARQELALALSREDILRDEMDHRVKNSLMQVAALLRAEAARTTNEAAKEALKRARNRVETIASVHRELNRTGGIQTVALAEFVKNLSEDFRAMLPENVSLVSDVDDIPVGTRHAVHVAMILNECVSNAVKYAFDEDQGGTIRILGRIEGDFLALSIVDDGRGRDESNPTMSGLGSRIVEAAAMSMSCEPEDVVLEKGYGLSFRIPTEVLSSL